MWFVFASLLGLVLGVDGDTKPPQRGCSPVSARGGSVLTVATLRRSVHPPTLLRSVATAIRDRRGNGFAPPQRYDIDADLKAYPQATAKEALASVLKAIAAKRIDYLLAHLADPQFVDQRVRDTGGLFGEVVKETTAKLLDDPGAAKQLRRFLDEGEWKIDGNHASVRLKDVSDRWVYLRKLGDRWYLENRQKPEPPKEKEP